MSQNFKIGNFLGKSSSIEFWASWSRLVQFFIVGVSGVFVDLGSFYGLHQLLGLMLTPSTVLSTELAIINNFFWNESWTFKDVSSRYPLLRDRLQRFVKFNAICLMGLVFNTLIVEMLFYKFGVNEYLAKIVAIACITLWNFGINSKLNWHVN